MRFTRRVSVVLSCVACTVTFVSAVVVTTSATPALGATATADSYPGDFYLQLVAGHDGLCLDVYGASTSDGAAIDQYTCKTGSDDTMPNQTFAFLPASGGYGELQNLNSGMDIAVQGASTAAGAPVIQDDPSGTADELWEPILLSNGSWMFQNHGSGLCLDVPGATTDQGQQLDQSYCDSNAANQAFATDLPGGDLVLAFDDGGIDPTYMSQVISTTWPESVGLSPGASLSSIVQAEWQQTSSATPGNQDPPTFSGGSVSVSGSTVTIDIPSGDVQANIKLPSFLAGFLAGLLGAATNMLTLGICGALLFPVAGAAPLWLLSICTGVATFAGTVVAASTNAIFTGTPVDQLDWANILGISFGWGVAAASFPWASPQMAAAVRYVANKAWTFIVWVVKGAGWILGKIGQGGAWLAQKIVNGVRSVLQKVRANTDVEMGALEQENGMAYPVTSGTVTSGFTGNCMDAYGSSDALVPAASPGQAVAINGCNGNAAQNWTVYSNGTVTVWGLCLDTNGGANSWGGTWVDLEYCDGNSSQVWNQFGTALVNTDTSQCLDDPAGNTSPGTQLEIWPCNGGTGQDWTLPSGSPRSNDSSCDIYASYGTPCVAAYSTTRALYGTYYGPLYQVQRASDGATADIGLLTTGGDVDASQQDSFCANTTCTITEIYDQSPYGNNLTIAGPGGNGGQDHGAVASALPITVGGNEAYGVDVEQGVGYRNNNTQGVATDGEPEGMYMVASGTHVNSGCCFDFGNAETNSDDNGAGHMDAVNLSTTCYSAPCSGSGPWVQADLENGLFMGSGSNTNNLGNNTSFVTAMLKNDGQNTFALKGGDSTSGGLSTWYDGSLPAGYAPMRQEGAIILGTGGDNSNSAVGSFFEGVMTAGYPSDAADDAVQADIVAAAYAGNTGNSSGGGLALPAAPVTLADTSKCMDALGDDNGGDGTPVDVWDCQPGAVDQHWTRYVDGTVRTLGKCLDIDGNSTALGAKLELWDCDGAGGQFWVQQPNGSLLNPQSGLCLDDPSGNTANGTVLQTYSCNGESPQVFHLNGGTPVLNPSIRKCIDVLGDDTGGDGSPVDIWDCQSDAADQHWTLTPGGQIETLGKCLDIDGNSTAVGAKLELWDCDGVGGQVWRQTPDGALVNPQSGLCLDDPSGSSTNGTVLQIYTCNGESPQDFPLYDASLWLPAAPVTLADGSKCMDVAGDDVGGDGAVVQVWDCQPQAVDQHWTRYVDGTVRTLGKCLDIDGNSTADGAHLELWDCDGAGGQFWVQQPDGSLYNPQSGRCLDDPSGVTTNGTPLQLYDCNGESPQVFHLNGGTPISNPSIGKCVDVAGDDTGGNGSAVDIWDCQSYAIDQHWTFTANEQIETLGRCLGVAGGSTTPGAKVELQDCDGSASQEWYQQPDGSQVNDASGLCLDDPSGNTANGTVLQIYTCNGESPQDFPLYEVYSQ